LRKPKLSACGIGIDGGGELGGAEPFLHQVEPDAGEDGGHPEAVPQSLGRGLRPVEIGRCHDGVDGTPAGHARPGPQAHPSALAAAGVQFADSVHQVERIEQGRGTGTARKIPDWRFFRVSNTSTPAASKSR
jgi:hypothetical protein